jgi:hypothetical protein
MSPILGIYASQISGHLFTLSGSYDALASVTVPSGGLSSITFAGIPTGYSHLQIRFLANNATNAYQKLQLNGDTTGANYYSHQLYGTGSATGASAFAGSSYNAIVTNGGGLGSGSYFGAGIIDILDYANTSKYKTVRVLNGYDSNATSGLDQFINLGSGVWQSTSAVTSITLFGNSYNYNQYSTFALYGIK